MHQCYCCSGQTYADCCGRYIEAGLVPASPSALMRSRYSAYAQANIDYIVATMSGAAAAGFDAKAAQAWASAVTWLGLTVVKARYHHVDPDRAMVEFIARYQTATGVESIHERSDFIRKNGKWYYSDGKTLTH